MSEQPVVSRPGEGETRVVGGADHVTYRVRSAETGGAYFCFEVRTMPGIGPPLHRHEFRELFYVVEGEYEFTVERDGELERVSGGPGTVVAVPGDATHSFRNATRSPSRMLIVQQPAALETFFDELGVPEDEAAAVGEPDFGAIAAGLERHGIHLVGAPA